ncbi:hypothetical protein Patl1_24509 [Pistacia atlantica]|uniref:Uncharacterized protein n=1 Tax=Pistacia atlantica TaxID=434234 RepID=A0ACC0ZYX4_9ROSI|nr:hypothetical protein Patl1_24509 [Pistacia atlantica]
MGYFFPQVAVKKQKLENMHTTLIHIHSSSLSKQTRISLIELGRSLKSPLRCKTCSSQRGTGNDDDEALVSDVETAQQWAAGVGILRFKKHLQDFQVTVSKPILSEQTRISLTELGRSLKSSLRRKTSSSQRGTGKDDDEALVSEIEIAQQWAAIERVLLTFDQLKDPLLNMEGEGKVVDGEGKRVVDVGPVERRAFMEKLIKHIEHDNLKLLRKNSERIEL